MEYNVISQLQPYLTKEMNIRDISNRIKYGNIMISLTMHLTNQLIVKTKALSHNHPCSHLSAYQLILACVLILVCMQLKIQILSNK
jgi:hypothetical protein